MKNVMGQSARGAYGRLLLLAFSAVIAVCGVGQMLPSAAAGVTTSSAATASQGHSHRLIVLAGSSQYLVYARYPTGHPGITPGVLHVVTRGGQNRALGSIPATTYRVQLAGSMLVALDGAHPHHVSWWNLAAGTSGSTTMGSHDFTLGATPDGWLFTPETTFGATSPLDESTTAGVTVELTQVWNQGGPIVDGLHMIETDAAGGKAVMSWSTPGVFTQLISDNYARPNFPGDDIGCVSLDSKIAACIGSTNTNDVVMSVPLDGDKRTTHTTCGEGTGPTAFGSSVVWINRCSSHLQQLQPNGHIRTSSRLYDSNAGTFHGLGRIIVLTKAAQAIDELTSITAKPKTLVHAG